jgi:GT2 family glycosyltransferase
MAERYPLKMLVGIATIGRPAVLRATLAMVAQQIRPADGVFVAPACDADVAGLDLSGLGGKRIAAEQGLCAQRNAILDAAAGYDAIVFFDDDFLPCKNYLAAVERAFLEEKDVVMTTGTVLFDGVMGPGLPVEAGARLVEDAERARPPVGPRPPVYNAYGCNMAFRLDPTRQGLRFDEALPLYGWLEDVDFSRRLVPYGRIVKLPDARGVHLGSKSGRSGGVRLGYSQIANPLYLVRKGTLSPARAAQQMGRNLAMNLLRSMVAEPYIDRRARLHGNTLALIDFLRGTADPAKISCIE